MMKYSYEENENVLIRISENGEVSSVPKDPANSDYQRYLRWLENPDADESGTL